MAEDTEQETVIVARPGLKGLITGIAPEDAIKESAVNLWNMRADQLGRLDVRPGYEVKHHSLNSGDDQVRLIAIIYNSSGNPDANLLLVGRKPGTTVKFYYGSTEKKSVAVTGDVAGIQGALCTSEAIHINLVAVGAGGLYKQYMSSSNCRVAALPMPTPGTMAGTSVSDGAGGSGTFKTGTAYYWKITFYNSVTGEESTIAATAVNHTPTTNNVKQTLSSLQVCTDDDEKADMHRRIYCAEGVSGTYRYAGVIADNTTTSIDITDPPGATADEAPTYTSLPTMGNYGCVAQWLDYVWICSNQDLYFNKSQHALQFDTASNKIPLDGTPLKLIPTDDRLWISTTRGWFFIPRPSSVTTANLKVIKYGTGFVEARNAGTITLCGNQIMFVQGRALRTLDGKAVSPLGPWGFLDKEAGDFENRNNFGFYDEIRNRYMLFCYLGVRDGSVSDKVCKDVLIYDFSRDRWEHDIHAGLFPCCIAQGSISHNEPVPPIIVGGAYGVVAYIEGGYSTGVSATKYLYDGLQSALTTGTATSGTGQNVTDTGASFTDAVIGCSCVVYRASVDTNGVRKWQYMGCAPIKARVGGTGLQLGHSIGFAVAAGDLYYVGAIPWLVKTPALMPGMALVRKVEVQHAGAMSTAYLVIPPDTDKETGWMALGPAPTGSDTFQFALSDARTGLRTCPCHPQVRCEGAQVQLCGYSDRCTISAITAYVEEVPEL